MFFHLQRTDIVPTLAVGLVGILAWQFVLLPRLPVAVWISPIGNVIYKDSAVDADFTGYKLRQCDIMDATGHHRYGPNEAWTEGLVKPLADPTPGITLPTGWHHFGVHRWNTGVFNGHGKPYEVMMVASHLCQGVFRPYKVYTTIGPFEVQ